MKTKLVGRLWLLIISLGMSSCVIPTYTMITGRYVAEADNFTVDLPQGWRQHNASSDAILRATLEKRHKLSWDVVRVTRDGLLLQQIAIGRIPLTDELPNTKKKFAAKMLPQEAAEIIIDELRSNTNLTNQEIVENTPATVGGYPGFKLHYTYRAEARLKMAGLFYGTLVGDRLYYIFYEAPEQYYFNKDLQLFEKTRASFTIGKGAVRK